MLLFKTESRKGIGVWTDIPISVFKFFILSLSLFFLKCPRNCLRGTISVKLKGWISFGVLSLTKAIQLL